MSRRKRVLLSAFACEPYKGSEPEVGWQWAMQISRFNDVTVLTRQQYRLPVEKVLNTLPADRPKPEFIYFDLPNWAQRLGKGSVGLRTYYVLWQKKARNVISELHREKPFDVMHHVTFATFRYPTAIWGHGVPSIWGPVGGIESTPPRLFPWEHPTSLAVEIFRNLNNWIQAAPFAKLPKRAAASTKTLVSTLEMQNALAKLGFKSQLMPTIGLETEKLSHQSHRQSEGPLRLLFVGKLIALKGIDLALRALSASGTNATLTLIGTGNYQTAAQRTAKNLGLGERVVFLGQLPREKVLKVYQEFDVMLFPSLHDTGGFAVIEAMFNELPVICLDCAGPAVAVPNGCGIKVSVRQNRQRVIEDLAAGIRRYDQDRGLLLSHGKAARQSILENYDWEKKGNQMNEVYEEIFRRSPGQRPILEHRGA
jgi:glycosyltransferase involved in cell wall biosynthesis